MTSLRAILYCTQPECCHLTDSEYALQGVDFLVYPGDQHNLMQLCEYLQPDVVLVQAPPTQASLLLQQVQTRFPRVKVALLASQLDVAQARSAIQNGARGYLLCPMPLDDLVWPVHLIYQGKITLSPEVTAALLIS